MTESWLPRWRSTPQWIPCGAPSSVSRRTQMQWVCSLAVTSFVAHSIGWKTTMRCRRQQSFITWSTVMKRRLIIRKCHSFNIFQRSLLTKQRRASAEAKWIEIGNNNGFIYVTASLVGICARAQSPLSRHAFPLILPPTPQRHQQMFALLTLLSQLLSAHLP